MKQQTQASALKTFKEGIASVRGMNSNSSSKSEVLFVHMKTGHVYFLKFFIRDEYLHAVAYAEDVRTLRYEANVYKYVSDVAKKHMSKNFVTVAKEGVVPTFLSPRDVADIVSKFGGISHDRARENVDINSVFLTCGQGDTRGSSKGVVGAFRPSLTDDKAVDERVRELVDVYRDGHDCGSDSLRLARGDLYTKPALRVIATDAVLNSIPFYKITSAKIVDIITDTEFIGVFFQVAFALEILARARVAHNDLHSGNVLVTLGAPVLAQYHLNNKPIATFTTRFRALIFDFDFANAASIGTNPIFTNQTGEMKTFNRDHNISEFVFPHADFVRLVSSMWDEIQMTQRKADPVRSLALRKIANREIIRGAIAKPSKEGSVLIEHMGSERVKYVPLDVIDRGARAPMDTLRSLARAVSAHERAAAHTVSAHEHAAREHAKLQSWGYL